MKTIRLGTRGSKLALKQASRVAERLRSVAPHVTCEMVTVMTSGDRFTGALAKAEVKGLFVKELEDALLDERIDAAVHSAKDLPTELPHGLGIAAVLEREDARDVLVCRDASSFDALPTSSRVGTCSIRRVAQLKRLRNDLEYVGIRGNVDTRLRKLDEGHFDAIVVAAAALKRLGLEDRITEHFEVDKCTPAVGQGVIAVEARTGDSDLLSLLERISHLPTRAALRAERSFLFAIGGGCSVAVGAYASVCGTVLHIQARICDYLGKMCIEGKREGSIEEAGALGAALAEELLDRGARELLKTDQLFQ